MPTYFVEYGGKIEHIKALSANRAVLRAVRKRGGTDRPHYLSVYARGPDGDGIVYPVYCDAYGARIVPGLLRWFTPAGSREEIGAPYPAEAARVLFLGGAVSGNVVELHEMGRQYRITRDLVI